MRGLSLLETIVSAALFLLMVVLLLNLFPQSLLGLSARENRTTGERLAQSLLNQQQDCPFADLPTGSRPLPGLDQSGVSYTATVEGFPIAGTNSARLWGLRVRVVWQERGSQREAVREAWVSCVAH